MLFADLGCIVGGYLPPLFQRWFGVNLIVSRKMVVTMGAVLMIGPGMIGLFTSPFVGYRPAVRRRLCSPGAVRGADYALFRRIRS
ncbi:Hexuronate transporter [Raoultella terrigena]|uniref:Hexuronate transporter n=1 Tax=Raoultella terrigena TaxID=577 RepID=A0A4U9D3T2_RAOTE|nr:Hexuronate transporter [Raoultella terrigena]